MTPIPTGTRVVDPSTLEPRADVRERLGVGEAPVAVFHGTGTHPPNREAATLIIEELGPAMADRDAELQFLIAGKGMPESSHPDVHTLGFVEDLDSLLHATDLAVVPIRHGGGTKTKIYDYLSHGLPMVTTEKGVEGIDVEDGREAVVLDDVDATFCEELAALAADAERQESMHEAVLTFAAERNWSTSGHVLQTTYESLLP